MDIQCPQCREKFDVELEAHVPKSQQLFMELTSHSEMFSARAIGEAIVNMEKLQRAVARDVGVNIAVHISSIDLKPHRIKIGFVMSAVAQ